MGLFDILFRHANRLEAFDDPSVIKFSDDAFNRTIQSVATMPFNQNYGKYQGVRERFLNPPANSNYSRQICNQMGLMIDPWFRSQKFPDTLQYVHSIYGPQYPLIRDRYVKPESVWVDVYFDGAQAIPYSVLISRLPEKAKYLAVDLVFQNDTDFAALRAFLLAMGPDNILSTISYEGQYIYRELPSGVTVCEMEELSNRVQLNGSNSPDILDTDHILTANTYEGIKVDGVNNIYSPAFRVPGNGGAKEYGYILINGVQYVPFCNIPNIYPENPDPFGVFTGIVTA